MTAPEMTPRDTLSAALDLALIESQTRWEDIRDVERKVHQMQADVQKFDTEAHRLRLALFAIDGESGKSPGDANKANHTRQIELRRGTDL